MSEIALANRCDLENAIGAEMASFRQESASVSVRVSPGCSTNAMNFSNCRSKQAFAHVSRADREVAPPACTNSLVLKSSKQVVNAFGRTGFELWERRRCHQQRHGS